MKCPNCNDGCKATKYCDGCKQKICEGCWAEHNQDASDHELIGAILEQEEVVVIRVEDDDDIVVAVHATYRDKLREALREYENDEETDLRTWLKNADFDTVLFHEVGDRKLNIAEEIAVAAKSY